MKVLVTGGAGYIGSHTCKSLAAAGYVPVVLDNLVSGHRSSVRWGPFIEGDIADRQLVAAILRDYSIEAVIHFAAYAYVGESMHSPAKYFENNVTGTLSLLEAMRESGTARIVFSSTCATYGIPSCLPIDESHLQRPVNPYGESKLFVERALQWYEQAYGLRSVALRYFNAAGADPDLEIGEEHDPETHLVPLVIQTALGLRNHIDIYGRDFDTPDGTAIRDYIHVTDLADAHVRAVRHLIGGSDSLRLNLGTGKGHSVLEVIKAVEAHSGVAVTSRNCPRRAGDPAELVANAALANKVLGWRPVLSSLPDIVATAWQWHERGVRSPEPSTWEIRAAGSAVADANRS